MDLRKINSYMILLAIVVVVGLFVSTVARLVILAKGGDAGTANLVFLIMLGTCAIAYLTILAAFSSIADFIADKILPKIARKKALTAEATRIPPIDDIPDSDVEQIKQEADKRFLERQKEQIELFRRYGHREVGPYITSDELVRLDRYIVAEIRICSACRVGGFLYQRETIFTTDTSIHHPQHSRLYGRTRRLIFPSKRYFREILRR